MRILIVDDSPGTRSAFRIGLTSMGYQIATAANGKEALRMLSENVDSDERPDLLLTDLRMPQMNGMELIHTVRKLLPNLPALDERLWR
jgi:CheY-like chemotaxis protein